MSDKILNPVEPFVGRMFSLQTMTESSIRSHYDGLRVHLTIEMNDGNESRTIRRHYARKFLDQFAGYENWNESNLTQIALGIFILDPKGLYQLTRAPRVCISTLVDVYRKDFVVSGSLFFTKLDFNEDGLTVTSQRDPELTFTTRGIKEVTTTAFKPIMDLGAGFTRK
ncbi:hypothetical protein [Vibrio phage VP4B]|uniref:Uncharacterized protein n=1 Tax=Vibrio phage VP4B TaxID=1262540 RepID=V9M0U5_9CAUD|nr:hypothetical protein FDJ61_gp194 [Vibrio phage VP4B]AGB07308.1 hypothetical protein [Vibrio phage VP4B]